MKFKPLLLLLFYIISFETSATNIRVVNLQNLIDNNQDLKKMISDIKKDQLAHTNDFKKNEIKLENELKRINDSKLILDSNQIDNEINKYNQDLREFNIKIENFNSHYELQVNNLKNQILQKVLDLLKKFSNDNEIDLILDSNSYILSNNSINITNVIEQQLNKHKFDTNFEKFK